MRSDSGGTGFFAWVGRHNVALYVALGVGWLLLSVYDLVMALTGSGTSREWFAVYLSAFLAVVAWCTALAAHRARRKADTDTEPERRSGGSEPE